MCNIAGYIGGSRAAPILLDMLSRQEGWGGGFYTGIATYAEGALHVRKVLGDVSRLRDTTDAADLPGTIGIAHSRSPSGGDREWAHPFVTCDEALAYVANGSLGMFKDAAVGQSVADRLENAGYVFASTVEGRVGTYPQLRDGRSIHFSDLMCGLIHAETECAGSLQSGFARAYGQFPGEIVGLALCRRDPGGIMVGRINMPMMLARGKGACYLATTAMAFPTETHGTVSALPANCVSRVTIHTVRSTPLEPIPGPVSDCFPWDAAVPAVTALLEDGAPHAFGDISKVTKPYWPGDTATQNAMMVYELLRGMIRRGLLTVDIQTVDGAEQGVSAPRFRVRMAAG